MSTPELSMLRNLAWGKRASLRLTIAGKERLACDHSREGEHSNSEMSQGTSTKVARRSGTGQTKAAADGRVWNGNARAWSVCTAIWVEGGVLAP